MRKATYSLAIVFLVIAIVATIAVSAIVASTAVNTARGAKSIADPVADLVRQLVVQATPVILPNPVMIVEEINSLARLETASYSFQDVVQVERNQEMLWGVLGESLLFVAYGDVIAGVDLAQMQPDDLQVVSPTEVQVHLPEASIFFATLDNDRSYVANRDIGLLAKGDPQLETLVRQEAEARMLEAALANGILEQADEEAQRFMRSFLGELSFVTVVFTEDTPPAVEPYRQEVPKGFVVTPAVPALASPTPAGP